MTTVKQASIRSKTRPQVLVVDDEPMLMEMISDLVAPHLPCRLVAAANLTEARKLIRTQRIELLVADVNLPDGDGTSLLDLLHETQPDASAIVVTGSPTLDGAITALRGGALDFVAKPFNAQQLTDRMRTALTHQAVSAKKQKRLARLKRTVRRLNEARKLVTRKVDLLCNDLVTAYGDLSKQVQQVRTNDSFAKYLAQAKDLEQMLCHAMDWILRQIGYANIAIWLTGDDGRYQLGAYMKYTIAGDQKLTAAMSDGLVVLTAGKGFVNLSAAEVPEVLSPAEADLLDGQQVLSAGCSYLGEGLGVITLFRNEDQPFTDEHAAILQSVAPIFAGLLAAVVKENDDFAATGEGDELSQLGLPDFDENADGDAPPPKSDPSADWWKRGDRAPF